MFAPFVIGSRSIEKEQLLADKKEARRYEDNGLGNKALYLGAAGLGCMRYLPLSSIKRVFKRLAVSKGFFESGKIYATIPYLVVQYDEGEKVIRFTREENLDQLLDDFRKNTKIPVGKPK